MRKKAVRNAAYASTASTNLGDSVASRNRNMKEMSFKKKETVNIPKGKGRIERITQGKMRMSKRQPGKGKKILKGVSSFLARG